MSATQLLQQKLLDLSIGSLVAQLEDARRSDSSIVPALKRNLQKLIDARRENAAATLRA
jgi:hypothetical protein